jgi:hypothetical protein
MDKILKGREVLIEIVPIGSMVRVSAMDVKTMTEISISGPANTPQAMLKNNALKRLEYVLRKKNLIK